MLLIAAGLVFSTGITGTGICHAVETIHINGSGNGMDMMKPMVAAYEKNNPSVRIVLGKPLGSSGAVKAMLAGALDLAIISRDLKPEEASQGAWLIKYGKTPLALVTGKDVHRSGITTRELEDIYAGRLNTWQNGSPIRLVLRPLGDSDTRILRSLSPGMDRAIDISHSRPGMIMAITDPDAYATILRVPGSLGAVGLNSIISEKLPLAILSLNGIKPSLNSLANGTYPLAKEFGFATVSKTSPAVQKLIYFVFSPQGKAIAKKHGVLVTAGPSAGR